MTNNQVANVVDFLVKSKALKFGEFTLKSGRKAPYFINTGSFDDGESISKLGELYANHIVNSGFIDIDVIFGPAYKGVPLCVATSAALASHHGKKVAFSFNRKEAKTHGDKGIFVGRNLEKGMRVVVVEDVVTAGTTLREIVPMLRQDVGVDLRAVVVLVDRCERGSGTCSAVQEVENEFGIKVSPLVTIHEIVNYLSEPNTSGMMLDAALLDSIKSYLKEFGCETKSA